MASKTVQAYVLKSIPLADGPGVFYTACVREPHQSPVKTGQSLGIRTVNGLSCSCTVFTEMTVPIAKRQEAIDLIVAGLEDMEKNYGIRSETSQGPPMKQLYIRVSQPIYGLVGPTDHGDMTQAPPQHLRVLCKVAEATEPVKNNQRLGDEWVGPVMYDVRAYMPRMVPVNDTQIRADMRKKAKELSRTMTMEKVAEMRAESEALMSKPVQERQVAIEQIKQDSLAELMARKK